MLKNSKVNSFSDIYDVSSKQHLKSFIEHRTGASIKNWNIISELLDHSSATKNETILNYGCRENHIRFLTKGVVKISCCEHGKSFIYDFREPHHFLCNTDSFIRQEASNFQIQAITDCHWLEIQRKHILPRIESDSTYGYIFSYFINYYLKRSQEKHISHINLNATERYQSLVAHRPEIAKHASLSDIASHLGIRLPSLSRIRKELSY